MTVITTRNGNFYPRLSTEATLPSMENARCTGPAWHDSNDIIAAVLRNALCGFWQGTKSRHSSMPINPVVLSYPRKAFQYKQRGRF
uniref:Uncharacterized protein n=1 Tax=Onchocerca volvulus TaxID=6282 RepID=A0A8R1TXP4_ONCVO